MCSYLILLLVLRKTHCPHSGGFAYLKIILEILAPEIVPIQLGLLFGMIQFIRFFSTCQAVTE